MAVHIRLATQEDIPEIVDVSMAAFDPSTDAISARLFPPHLQSADSEAFKNWSVTRKSARLDLKNSVVMVAVDEALGGRVVGYAMWFSPIPEGSEEEEPPRPKVAFEGVDRDALLELRKIMEDDAHNSFGEKGSKDVWSEFYPIRVSRLGCVS